MFSHLTRREREEKNGIMQMPPRKLQIFFSHNFTTSPTFLTLEYGKAIHSGLNPIKFSVAYLGAMLSQVTGA